jgi:S-formylglutathione hydrolase
MSLTCLSKTKSFDGTVEFYSHASSSTRTDMRFSVFRPPQSQSRRVPVLYWLSGLTCTEENFMAKAGAQRLAAKHGLMLVAPDTSPRGPGVAEGDSWDLGLGAGFYVNATQPKWAPHYRMFDYIAHELPALVREHFPILGDREGIFGHSMGGHGALVLALRQPGRYLSVSAFAPIVAPMDCPWGVKAFTNYLGDDKALWAEYDTCRLIAHSTKRVPFLVDQGTEDKFLKDQLKPHLLKEACLAADYPLDLRMRDGYDHSYYFIASFMESHIEHHAKALNAF